MFFMCVGVPGQIIKVSGSKAKVKQSGHSHWLDTSLINGGVQKGDWVISYQNAAINKVSAAAAREVINLLGETDGQC